MQSTLVADQRTTRSEFSQPDGSERHGAIDAANPKRGIASQW
jgi:hypothetical protein